jgi:hypothetical protein
MGNINFGGIMLVVDYQEGKLVNQTLADNNQKLPINLGDREYTYTGYENIKHDILGLNFSRSKFIPSFFSTNKIKYDQQNVLHTLQQLLQNKYNKYK